MSEPSSELVVVREDQPQTSSPTLAKLAAFMGVPVRELPLPDGSGGGIGGVAQALRRGGCVSLSARAMRRLHGDGQWPGMTQAPVDGHPGRLFVYGFEPGEENSDLVRKLSQAAYRSVRTPDAGANEYAANSHTRPFCQEFSGLSFGPINPHNDLVFERAADDPRAVDYIRIGQHPFLVGFQRGGVHVLLAGTRQILDIDSPAQNGLTLEHFGALVPAMMFLRHVFTQRSWQATRKLACFILDDPLLRRRHGFLRYDGLLEAMERSHFATNISFIPWNYRRSQADVARMFKRFPHRLSLSVHGCDHTKGEFASADVPLLDRKAKVALERMRLHQQLTGLPFDRVMVFPQGAFSPAALGALSTAGYLAAVNSSPFPAAQTPSALRWRDLLHVPVIRYGGVPLFVRRYPNRIAEFALDLFLGKPALAVQHHGYFRHGCDAIEAFAQQLNRLSPAITWCGLEEVALRANLRRTEADGKVRVRFYTREAALENDEAAPRCFRLESPAFEPFDAVPLLAADGRKLRPWQAGAGFGGEVELQPDEVLRIKAVLPEADVPLGAEEKEGLLYRLRAFGRRRLCEFRDNYLSLAWLGR